MSGGQVVKTQTEDCRGNSHLCQTTFPALFAKMICWNIRRLRQRKHRVVIFLQNGPTGGASLWIEHQQARGVSRVESTAPWLSFTVSLWIRNVKEEVLVLYGGPYCENTPLAFIESGTSPAPGKPGWFSFVKASPTALTSWIALMFYVHV